MSESNDLLHRFIFDNTDIRGEIVTLTDSLAQMFQRQQYPGFIQDLLGEFMAAVALLSSTLKFDGRLILQAHGNGPLNMIVAEADHQQRLRGIAKLQEAGSISRADLPGLIGDGALSITIDPDQGNRYQGIVPLDAPTLADCLEHYFMQSEQLPTKIWLAAEGNRAGGLLLQQLPQQIATHSVNADAWDNRIQLANTLTPNELMHLEHPRLLTRLFHEEGVRCLEPSTLKYSCSCSKQRSGMALKQLGKKDVEQLLLEQSIITIDCEFCGMQYTYNKADVNALFSRDGCSR